MYARKQSRITAPKRKAIKSATRRPPSCTQSTSGTQTNQLTAFGLKPEPPTAQYAWPETGRETLVIELVAPPLANQRRGGKAPAFRPAGGVHFSRWRPQSAPRTLPECKDLVRSSGAREPHLMRGSGAREPHRRPYSAQPVQCRAMLGPAPLGVGPVTRRGSADQGGLHGTSPFLSVQPQPLPLQRRRTSSASHVGQSHVSQSHMMPARVGSGHAGSGRVGYTISPADFSTDNIYLSMKCPRDYVVKINFVPPN